MMYVEAETYDSLQREVLGKLATAPEYESRPRDMLVREVLGATLVLTDPRARLSLSPVRAVNYGFASGEFLWYLRGARDLESIVYYNKRMAEFSDDGATLNSAYGHRVGRGPELPESGVAQWARVVDTLKRDPDSRRAVMTIYSPRDLEVATTKGTKDVPCTLSLQFFVRAGRLHLQVNMRSNDAVWGLANDLFSFTLLQEAMMLDLRELAGMDGLELGHYVHTAGSLHLYERHFELAARVAVEPDRPREAGTMPAIAHRQDLRLLLDDEVSLRERREVGHFAYGGGAAWLFDRLLAHRMRRDAEAWPQPATVARAAA